MSTFERLAHYKTEINELVGGSSEPFTTVFQHLFPEPGKKLHENMKAWLDFLFSDDSWNMSGMSRKDNDAICSNFSTVEKIFALDETMPEITQTVSKSYKFFWAYLVWVSCFQQNDFML